MGVVTIEIKDDLRPDDFGDAARVAVLFFLQVDVALLEVAHAVEDDELDFLPEAAVEARLKARYLVVGVGLRISGQVVATLIEIYVELIVHVVRPMEISPLHAVLPEGHVHAVVELGPCRWQQGQQQEEYRVFSFRQHYL